MDSALLLFQQTADYAAKHKFLTVTLNAILNMAWCALDYNELDLFQQYLQKGYRLMRENKRQLDSLDSNREIRSQFIYTAAMYRYELGQFEQAINEFNSILFDRNKLLNIDSILAFNTYTAIGKSFFNLGNYDKAIETYDLAYQIIPHTSESYFGAIDYNYYFALNRSQVGEAYFKKGLTNLGSSDYMTAAPYYHAALKKLNEKRTDSSIKNLLITNYNRLAALHQQFKQYDSALLYLKKSLDTNPSSEVELNKTYLFFGDIYLALKDYKKASAYYQMRLDKINEKLLGKHYSKGVVLYHLGKVYAAQGKSKNALAYYQKSLVHLIHGFDDAQNIYKNPESEIIDLNSTNEVITVLLLKAQALYQTYIKSKENQDIQIAIKTYELLSALVDKMRREFPSKEFKEFLSSKSATLYDNALEAAYEAYKVKPDSILLNIAFKFAERGKSLLLLETFRNSHAKAFAGVPDEYLKKENELVDKVMYLSGALFKVNGSGEELGLKNKIAVLQRDYHALIERIEKDYPAYYKLKYSQSNLSPAQVQRNLLSSDKEAFVEYTVGNNCIYVFVITKSNVDFFKLPSNAKVLQMVIDIRDGLLKRDFNKYTANAFSLYNQVFSVVDSTLSMEGISKVTIVADGHLHYVPFEILLTQKTVSENNFSNLKYLLKNYQINYQYSAALAREIRLNKAGEASKTMLGYAPAFANNLSNNEKEGIGITRNELNSLQGARYELETIKKNFRGDYYLEEQATERSFKEVSNQYKILHLATHAIINDQNPHLSRLVFSDKGDSLQDGSLYSYELYNLKLNADLVTLSACNTGTGKLQRGEGLISLARGFMYAGCTNVLMSLWPASDQSTARVMELFYEGIKNGLPKDEALRNAKLAFLAASDPLMANPYYWAGFVFVGNPAPIHVEQTNINWLLYVAIVITILIILLMIRIIRKKP